MGLALCLGQCSWRKASPSGWGSVGALDWTSGGQVWVPLCRGELCDSGGQPPRPVRLCCGVKSVTHWGVRTDLDRRGYPGGTLWVGGRDAAQALPPGRPAQPERDAALLHKQP